MIQQDKINKKNNFIHAFKLKNINLCDEIIEHHKKCNTKYDGMIGFNGECIVDKNQKDSTDCNLLENENLSENYFKELQLFLNEYIDKYPYCNKYSAFASIEATNIQHYKPNGGYFNFHTERTSANYPQATRHLVYITYLNDVTDDGETEFFHQKLKIKPEKGLTVIFPADWTFTHRGIPSKTQEKYIVTGWMNYI